MRALVVYESMYGNTHAVAASIADGLRDTCEVTLVPVGAARAELVAAADLLVVGGPTHLRGLSSAGSRQAAAKAAGKQANHLSLDPDADGPGLREWLQDIGDRRVLAAAAFDTRLSDLPVFTGRACRSIGRLLKQHGCRLIAPPESFLVSHKNILLIGEAARARRWGAALGTAASKAHRPVHA
jgi:Flavodoxin domain